MIPLVFIIGIQQKVHIRQYRSNITSPVVHLVHIKSARIIVKNEEYVKQDTETDVHENYHDDIELPKDDFKDVEESLETENISKLNDESKENCCKICGTSFRNKYILKHHMNVEHNDNKIIEDKPLSLELTLRGFVCNTCDDTL